MGKCWVIPDIHGCAKTLQSLVGDLIRPGRLDELYFLGDYIDRGPDSKGVIDYICSLKREGYHITALKGNHDALLTEIWDAEQNHRNPWWRFNGTWKNNTWMEIGGMQTLESFGVSKARDIPEKYITWMRKLPYYVELDRFVLVHAGLNFTDVDPFKDKRAMLWSRDFEIRPEKIGGRRIIHGHVPVNMELITLSVQNSSLPFIDLDNGPYITGREGFGNMVALELGGMEMVIQYNRDV